MNPPTFNPKSSEFSNLTPPPGSEPSTTDMLPSAALTPAEKANAGPEMQAHIKKAGALAEPHLLSSLYVDRAPFPGGTANVPDMSGLQPELASVLANARDHGRFSNSMYNGPDVAAGYAPTAGWDSAPVLAMSKEQRTAASPIYDGYAAHAESFLTAQSANLDAIHNATAATATTPNEKAALVARVALEAAISQPEINPDATNPANYTIELGHTAAGDFVGMLNKHLFQSGLITSELTPAQRKEVQDYVNDVSGATISAATLAALGPVGQPVIDAAKTIISAAKTDTGLNTIKVLDGSDIAPTPSDNDITRMLKEGVRTARENLAATTDPDYMQRAKAAFQLTETVNNQYRVLTNTATTRTTKFTGLKNIRDTTSTFANPYVAEAAKTGEYGKAMFEAAREIQNKQESAINGIRNRVVKELVTAAITDPTERARVLAEVDAGLLTHARAIESALAIATSLGNPPAESIRQQAELYGILNSLQDVARQAYPGDPQKEDAYLALLSVKLLTKDVSGNYPNLEQFIMGVSGGGAMPPMIFTEAERQHAAELLASGVPTGAIDSVLTGTPPALEKPLGQLEANSTSRTSLEYYMGMARNFWLMNRAREAFTPPHGNDADINAYITTYIGAGVEINREAVKRFFNNPDAVPGSYAAIIKSAKAGTAMPHFGAAPNFNFASEMTLQFEAALKGETAESLRSAKIAGTAGELFASIEANAKQPEGAARGLSSAEIQKALESMANPTPATFMEKLSKGWEWLTKGGGWKSFAKSAALFGLSVATPWGGAVAVVYGAVVAFNATKKSIQTIQKLNATAQSNGYNKVGILSTAGLGLLAGVAGKVAAETINAYIPFVGTIATSLMIGAATTSIERRANSESSARIATGLTQFITARDARIAALGNRDVSEYDRRFVSDILTLAGKTPTELNTYTPAQFSAEFANIYSTLMATNDGRTIQQLGQAVDNWMAQQDRAEADANNRSVSQLLAAQRDALDIYRQNKMQAEAFAVGAALGASVMGLYNSELKLQSMFGGAEAAAGEVNEGASAQGGIEHLQQQIKEMSVTASASARIEQQFTTINHINGAHLLGLDARADGSAFAIFGVDMDGDGVMEAHERLITQCSISSTGEVNMAAGQYGLLVESSEMSGSFSGFSTAHQEQMGFILDSHGIAHAGSVEFHDVGANPHNIVGFIETDGDPEPELVAVNNGHGGYAFSTQSDLASSVHATVNGQSVSLSPHFVEGQNGQLYLVYEQGSNVVGITEIDGDPVQNFVDADGNNIGVESGVVVAGSPVEVPGVQVNSSELFDNGTYTVVEGDSLWGILDKTLTEIEQDNGITIPNRNQLINDMVREAEEKGTYVELLEKVRETQHNGEGGRTIWPGDQLTIGDIASTAPEKFAQLGQQYGLNLSGGGSAPGVPLSGGATVPFSQLSVSIDPLQTSGPQIITGFTPVNFVVNTVGVQAVAGLNMDNINSGYAQYYNWGRDVIGGLDGDITHDRAITVAEGVEFSASLNGTQINLEDSNATLLVTNMQGQQVEIPFTKAIELSIGQTDGSIAVVLADDPDNFELVVGHNATIVLNGQNYHIDTVNGSSLSLASGAASASVSTFSGAEASTAVSSSATTSSWINSMYASETNSTTGVGGGVGFGGSGATASASAQASAAASAGVSGTFAGTPLVTDDNTTLSATASAGAVANAQVGNGANQLGDSVSNSTLLDNNMDYQEQNSSIYGTYDDRTSSVSVDGSGLAAPQATGANNQGFGTAGFTTNSSAQASAFANAAATSSVNLQQPGAVTTGTVDPNTVQFSQTDSGSSNGLNIAPGNAGASGVSPFDRLASWGSEQVNTVSNVLSESVYRGPFFDQPGTQPDVVIPTEYQNFTVTTPDGQEFSFLRGNVRSITPDGIRAVDGAGVTQYIPGNVVANGYSSDGRSMTLDVNGGGIVARGTEEDMVIMPQYSDNAVIPPRPPQGPTSMERAKDWVSDIYTSANNQAEDAIDWVQNQIK